MAEAKLKIKQKHDTEVNWLKATTFVPLDGELIIYDVDDTHSTPRFKVGDGIQVVGDLPFLADGINSQYLRNNYIPIKEITSGSFIVPQIGYNKEIYWLNSDVNIVERSLAQRYENGRLRVGDPVEDQDAMPKKYAESNFIPLKQFTSGPFQIPQIGYNKELNWIDCNVSISAQSIVQRDGNGIIYINPPDTVPENINEYAAVNVQYANKTYVKAINVTENTYVYAASSEGPNGRLRVSPTVEGGIVVQTTADATVRTNDPKNVYDAVNLQYLNKNAALLAANNTFMGINIFHKEETATSGDKTISEAKIDPGPTAPLILLETKTVASDGLTITGNATIRPDSIVLSDNGSGYTTSITHDGFTADNSGIYTKYYTGSIVHNTASSGTKQTLNFPDKSGTIALLSDIPSSSGDVTLAGNNTFTGTNKFTSNTLEVNDGKSLSDGGKAAIFSASSMKLYDGTAGRNYTINFPAYSSVLSGNATLVTNVDILNWGYIKSSDNITFTGSNIFKKSVDFTYGIISISNVSSSSSPNTDGIYFTDTSNNTLCWYQGNKWTTDTGKVIKLPTSAGTLALTSDIKIKSASLDGTTLTLTI